VTAETGRASAGAPATKAGAKGRKGEQIKGQAKGQAKGQGRERLLATAVRLFGERGFDAVATKELALAAGVTIGALYHHFPGKEAIYQAAFLHALDLLEPAPMKRASAASPRAGSELLVAWFSQALLAEPLIRQELLVPRMGKNLSELPFFATPLDLFRRIMPEGAPGIDPNLAMAAIVSLTFGMTMLRGISNYYQAPADPDEMAALIIDLVLGPDKSVPAGTSIPAD